MKVTFILGLTLPLEKQSVLSGIGRTIGISLEFRILFVHRRFLWFFQNILFPNF